MSQVAKIEVPVEEATAHSLSDARRLQAVGRLIYGLVRPGADDPLIALLEKTTTAAHEAGLPGEEIEAELAVYNAERRS